MIFSFKSFYVQQDLLIHENWITSILTWFHQRLVSFFAKLGFGQTQEIIIPMENTRMEEAVGADIRALVGYYAEIKTAQILAEQIKSGGGRLSSNTNTNSLTKQAEERLTRARRAGASPEELTRATMAATAIGTQMWADVLTTATDLPFLTFDIELAGESQKGKSKADLILRVTKDNEETVIDTIMASLKVYKTANINLANTSFISLIKKLFYDERHPIQSRSVTVEDFIAQFTKDYGAEMKAELEKLYQHQQLISREMERGRTKEKARKLAKLSHPDVIDLIVRIFHSNYTGRRKSNINQRFLKLLGFDGGEDFYAAIGTRKIRVLSSRQSEGFQRLMDALKTKFTITIERNKNTNNALVSVIGPDDEIVLRGTLTFADSGGSAAAGKTNFFVDFSNL